MILDEVNLRDVKGRGIQILRKYNCVRLLIRKATDKYPTIFHGVSDTRGDVVVSNSLYSGVGLTPLIVYQTFQDVYLSGLIIHNVNGTALLIISTSRRWFYKSTVTNSYHNVTLILV